MFVRELVALDGTDLSEFMLIDTDGCPTDLAIMKPIEKMSQNGQTLETRFEAFKFPTSDIVQFKALVTPCVANCEPVNCNINLPSGRTSQTQSYGRRRRRSVGSGATSGSYAPAAATGDAQSNAKKAILNDLDNVIVVEQLSVSDKFTAKNQKDRKRIEKDRNSEVYDKFESKFF